MLNQGKSSGSIAIFYYDPNSYSLYYPHIRYIHISSIFGESYALRFILRIRHVGHHTHMHMPKSLITNMCRWIKWAARWGRAECVASNQNFYLHEIKFKQLHLICQTGSYGKKTDSVGQGNRYLWGQGRWWGAFEGPANRN